MRQGVGGGGIPRVGLIDSAQRAYRFAAGVVGRGQAITLPAAPWRLDGGQLALACAPGILRSRAAQAANYSPRQR